MPDCSVKGELLQFRASDNILLEGFLSGPKKNSTCIVYVHEWGGNFYHAPAIGLAEELSKRGLSIFTINTRGHDVVTDLTKGFGRDKVRFRGGVEFERFEDTILDIKVALARLSRLGFKKFVLCGHSTGGQKVAYYQYKENDKRVVGLILISAGDDYNIWKDRILGRKFDSTVAAAKKLVKSGHGYQLDFTNGDTPQRFLSVADLRNVEARLFNYKGNMNEFGKIKIPILAMFGGDEKFAEYHLRVMAEKTNSRLFEPHIVKGAAHRYYERESKAAGIISNFVKKL